MKTTPASADASPAPASPRALTARVESPVGPVWVRCRASDGAVEEIALGDGMPDWAASAGESGGAGFGAGGDPAAADRLQEACRQLEEYFAGRRREFSVPLAPEGTRFQRRVWDELARIPYGETISYRELARRSGNPKASRAVGGANGRNPLPVIIPCHRVIAADGSLGGYSSGLERKRELLALEGALAV